MSIIYFNTECDDGLDDTIQFVMKPYVGELLLDWYI